MNRFIPIVLLFAVGCTGSTGDTKPTAPVKVTVTQKGKPVEGATVTFTVPNNPPPAFGITDAQGVATLKTYKDGDGALIGSHTVTIVKVELGKSKGKDEGSQDEGNYKPSPGETPIPTLKDLLPGKYKLPGTSGLTADVKSGKNEFTFDLSDK